MAFEFDKTFVADFIDEYKNHPALWNVKSVISKNKHLRNKGIEALVLKCKERIPEADDSFVKKKINNLRTAYKRELAKVRASKRTGSSADEIYVPTLWYFDLLSFTMEYETGREGISSTDDSVAFSDTTETDLIDENIPPESDDTQSVAQRVLSPSPSPRLHKKQKSFITKKREFIDIASETMKALNNPIKEDDEYDVIGKRFAIQLRGMKDHQMFLAEKIIGDVMYYGRMEKLTENCFQFNNTNISTTEPQINTNSMYVPAQNSIIRPTFHSHQNSQKLTPPQENIYNQQRQYNMLENTYQVQSPYLHHDTSQPKQNAGHNIQQYTYGLDSIPPITQHKNRVNWNVNTASSIDNPEAGAQVDTSI